MNRILVTGTTGFIGKHLVYTLKDKSETIAVTRSDSSDRISNVRYELIRNLDAYQCWVSIIENVDCIIHCAARVHVMDESSPNPLKAFREINVDGTLNLARQAARNGVKRFVFISSIKVNGESTQPENPFTENSKPNPLDPYGISKLEAEEGLKQISSETGMEYVIIRPVLIYGPGVKANFARLVNLVKKGIPVPLRLARNKRSLVSLDNLVDLIETCIRHPRAANKTFLASDGHDLSTSELISEIALCMNKRPALLPFPISILRLLGKCTGKSDIIARLTESLQVDISHTRKTLDWRPPYTVHESLQKTVDSLVSR